LIDGKTGILVPHADVAALAGAMRRIIEDRSAAERMGVAGRRFAGQFTWDNSATQTLDHLESVVRGGKGKWR
jgi:glycosyltransferase involved in cell wall biosynthesis